MSKYFTRKAFQDAPLVEDVLPPKPAAAPATAAWPIPSGLNRAQVIETHGQSLGQVAWEAEVRLRAELVERVRGLQERMAEVNRAIDLTIAGAQPRLNSLQDAVTAAYNAYLTATAECENAKAAVQASVAPLRGEVESLLRELHGPVHFDRITWKPETPAK